MRKIYYILFLSVPVLLLSINASHLQALEADKRLDIAGTEEFQKAVSGSRVIFVGESHLSKLDHAVQLEVIRHLNEKGEKVAVSVEMFPGGMQHFLNSWNEGKVSEEEFIAVYKTTWIVSYSLYRDIFLYARQNSIPLFGINFDKSHVRHLLKMGISSVPKASLDLIKFESCDDNPGYKRAMRSYWPMLNHTKGFTENCNIMRFKEGVMAYNISQILQKEDYTVVVLLGASHAIKSAVPSMLEKHHDADYAVLVPERLKNLTKYPLTHEEADFMW